MPLNYPAIVGLVGLHVMALASIVYIALVGIGWAELGLHVAFYFAGGFGITALYHRAWAHNAVQLARPIEYALAASSTLVVQMPARQWIVAHIEHHKHTDHEADPYNINNGFWWAHCKWIFFDQKVDQPLPARLANNPVIAWQHNNYWTICFTMNILVPTAVALAVGAPWWSGFLLSCLRMAVMEHVVFSVNSVCHFWGTQPYSKAMTAKDVWWFPFALGEQYHNYHHAFPRDYRHGIRRLDFDPTKWLIDGLARLGWARNLVTMPEETVLRAKASAGSGTEREGV